MNIIKITTDDIDLVKPYMNDIMSFDNGLIEIIVGWDLAKSKGASILNHIINDTTYWTFSPREKRKIFEEHLKTFLEDSLENMTSKIKINNLNPLDFSTEKDYLNYVKENVVGCDGYLYSNRLYIYCGKTIHHIDMGLLSFISWDLKDKITELITLKKYEELPKNLGKIDIKYIPYLNAKEDIISRDIY